MKKKAHGDIKPTIVLLTKRIKSPHEDDWNHLCKMIDYLKPTQEDLLALKADGNRIIKRRVVAPFVE